MTELTETYTKAVELNRKIITNAQMAQQSIYDMCIGLKTMRDEKLYKELGYQNFEDYCENEVGFSRQQAHKYIQILENVNPGLHFEKIGITKLYLLSSLSEEDKEVITQENNIEEITKRELEAKIKEIADLRKTNDGYEKMVDLRDENIKRLKAETESLKKAVDELKNRPIPAEYSENDNDERRLTEANFDERIREIDRQAMVRNEELAKQYEEQDRAMIQRMTEENNKAIADVKAEYEAKLAELKTAQSSPAVPDDKEVFKAYFTTAYDSFGRLIEYTNKKANPLFTQKIHELINKLGSTITEVK